MKNLRLFVFASTSLVLGAAIVLVACGGDDSAVTVTPDGGADTGRDGTTTDTGGGDTGVTDAGTDVANIDAGLKLETFADTIAENLCNTLTRCCFNNASVADGGAVDGGTFDRSKCVDLYSALGFESSLLGSEALTKGNVTLDQAKGADCIAKLKVLSCSLTGTELKTARAACFGALSGKLATNQPCRASLECAPGNFCLPDLDGGAADAGPDAGGSTVIGKCAGLRGSGGNCSIVDTTGPCAGDPTCVYNQSVLDSNPAEEACSSRGGGDTNLHCNSWDAVGGVYRTRDQWTCQATIANDAGCNSTVWCSDGVCDPTDNYVCKSPVTYFTPASCNTFVNP
jgi:hypothetical protein